MKKDHFQEELHMKIIKKIMLLLWIWPLKSGGWKKLLYEFYFVSSFVYFLVFSVNNLIVALTTWSNNYLATATSIGFIIENFSSAYKVLLFKSNVFKNLIYDIRKNEEELFKNGDMDLKKLYLNNSRSNKKVVIVLILMGTVNILLFFITPLINNSISPLGVVNETGVIKHYFIVNSWYPFDSNLHYSIAYFLQSYGCFLDYSYVVHGSALYVSILNFIKVRLNSLQFILKNLNNYAEHIKKDNVNLNDQACYNVVLRNVVQEHLKIISFVHRLNKLMNKYWLINFLTSSFQMSLVLFSIVKSHGLKKYTMILYFSVVNLQILLIYRSAHLIIIESENIASSIFQGPWNQYSIKTLKFLQMICMRARRPLAFKIGPFSEMNLDAVVQVYKGFYSYICILMEI